MRKQLGLGVLGMLLCSAMAAAQATLTVPTSLTAGQNISIGYSDPSRAGQTIVVTIDQCTDERVIVEVYIHLDQTGGGAITWTVPDVDSVMFNAPGVKQITRAL